MEPRIVFDRVWKKFHRGQVHDSLRDLIPALAKRIIRRDAPAELETGDFWAVRDLSFEVVPGQTVGIIGPNGSGKSTTLKIVTKIMEPERGYCEVEGRLGALIEVSAGFHGDLTGRENVFLQGAIMGMRSADIARKFDEIVEFSGVVDAIDTPVKRYSSGMNARLGFSIAAHLEPDVLIIDEVLAVGDLSFQERAFGRVREMARSGIPVLMVSHQLDRIAELCTDVILLKQGEVLFRGRPDEAISAYIGQYDTGRAPVNTGMVEIDVLRAANDADIVSGTRFALQVEGRVLAPLGPHIDPVLLRLRSLRTGNVIYYAYSRRMGLDLSKPGPFRVQVELQANVPAGGYMVEVGAHDAQAQKEIASGPSTVIRVTDPGTFFGSVQLNGRMTLLD